MKRLARGSEEGGRGTSSATKQSVICKLQLESSSRPITMRAWQDRDSARRHHSHAVCERGQIDVMFIEIKLRDETRRDETRGRGHGNFIIGHLFE